MKKSVLFLAVLLLSTMAHAVLGNPGDFRASQCGDSQTTDGKIEVCVGSLVGFNAAEMKDGVLRNPIYIQIGGAFTFGGYDSPRQGGLGYQPPRTETLEMNKVTVKNGRLVVSAASQKVIIERQGNKILSIKTVVEDIAIDASRFEAMGGAL